MEQPAGNTNGKLKSPTVESMLAQATQLRTKVLSFQDAAKAQHTSVDQGTNPYLKTLTAEFRALEKLAALAEPSVSNAEDKDENGDEDGDPEGGVGHTLRSSNIGFLTIVWEMARRCRNVRGLSRRIGPAKKTCFVDVIADEGLLWVKLVTNSERKLVFEIAKEGWDEEMWDEFPQVKNAVDLVDAAKKNKTEYQPPEVLMYFPNLEEDEISNPMVKQLIERIRETGTTVHCGSGDIKLRTLPPILQDAPDGFKQMLPKPMPDLTPVINIDCTILLALISDLSHMELDESDVYNEPLKRQLAAERDRPLLPKVLYPGLVGRKLITSKLAAHRMREIVGTLATPEERMRADTMLKEGTFADSSSDTQDLLDHFRKHSQYDVPADLRLPIEIIDTETETANVPQEAFVLQPILTSINWSVTSLGWSRKITTITSNRVAARQIENIINDLPGNIIGPQMWVIDIARSLVGKERTRR